MSASDISKVSNWLTSQGFKVTGTARSSTFITFTGTVAQAEKAFGTNIHTLSFNGETHFSNMTNPALPSAIANVVVSVTGLNDFKAKPRGRFSKVKVNPNYTATGSACATGSSACYYIAPGDFYTIYDETPLLSNSINGSGITIAVMGQSDLPTGAALQFRSAAGLSPANLPTTKTYGTDPGIQSGDVDEASLDVEWAGAVAPNASILFVNGSDVFTNALTQAIDNNLAPIITISYGICESQVNTNYSITGLNQLLEQANAEGITVISASGDSGATDCDATGLASEGLAVDFPGSSPYATSAGGTMFSGDVGNTSAYWNGSNSNNGTNQYTSSVKSYIPESSWNETNASTGLTAGGAGGGGASAYFSKPAWQAGTGVPADGSRDVPDFSLNAGAIHDGTIVCSQGDCTNGFADSTGFIDVFGGTSVAAPSFAGMLALVEQKQGGGRLGNIGPNLYGLAGVANVFHDITSGNNSVYCIQGTPNCSNGGPIGYNAGVGYDQATGLGSVDAANFVNNWTMGVPIGASGGPTAQCTSGTQSIVCTTMTTITTSAALCGITSGSLPLSVTVASSSSSTAMPTGTVQFYVDTTAVGTAPLVNGAATYTLNTSALSSGGHNLTAVYSGDGTFAGSKGALLENSSNTGIISPIDVVSPSNDFSITPCTATTTVITGTAATAIPLVITPTAGFTGTINLSANSDKGDVMGYAFSVKPVTITSSSGAVTTQFVLTATESASSAAARKLKSPVGHHPTGKAPWYAAGSGATLACLFLIVVPKRRRWGTLFALLLSVAMISSSGCSSSSSNTGGNGGSGGNGGGTGLSNASPGTYNITITATSGSLVHSVVLTYIVQ